MTAAATAPRLLLLRPSDSFAGGVGSLIFALALTRFVPGVAPFLISWPTRTTDWADSCIYILLQHYNQVPFELWTTDHHCQPCWTKNPLVATVYISFDTTLAQ